MPTKSEQSEWLEQLPEDTFFRPGKVPGRSRGAVYVFLHRENAKPEQRRRAVRVAPTLYWKPSRRRPHTDWITFPDIERIGWELAGPGAGALELYGAHLIGWSTQLAIKRTYGVPGEPKSRRPLPGVEMRGRRNLSRRHLTNLEATYLEAVIGFDRWVEFEPWHIDGWQTALDITRINLKHRIEDGRSLPRADVLRSVARNERPASRLDLFRTRIESLLEVFDDFAASAADFQTKPQIETQN